MTSPSLLRATALGGAALCLALAIQSANRAENGGAARCESPRVGQRVRYENECFDAGLVWTVARASPESGPYSPVEIRCGDESALVAACDLRPAW